MNLICLRLDRRPDVGAWLVLGVSPNIYKLKATLCGLLCLRKVCPGILVWNGMQFPLGTRLGKPDHPESPSHFGRIRARNHRPIRPSINKEAPSRTTGHEVHREFRTQRRPLNVAFVLRRTVEQETSCPDAREDVAFRKMNRPPSAMGATLPARPSWRLQPCYPDPPWWGDPLRQPSCRAAS